MSGSQADLRSVAQLESLAALWDSAPAKIEACLRETEDGLSPRLRRLERHVEEARRALAQVERQLEAAQSQRSDEDGQDRSAAAAAEALVEEAREHLDRIEGAVSDVRHAMGRYRAAAADLNTCKSGAIADGAQYLAARIAGAREYLSVQVSTSGERPRGGDRAGNSISEPGFDPKSAAMMAANVALNLAAAANIVGGFVAPDPNEFQRLSNELMDHEAITFEMRNQALEDTVEVAVRNDAAPQVTLFDPTLGPKRDRNF